MLAIEASILKTLLFFDQLDVPLSVTELTRFGIDLPPNTSFSSMVTALENLRQQGKIECLHGSWLLVGRTEIVRKHFSRLGQQFYKWRRLRLAALLVRFVPHLRMICLTNTLAVDAADPKSDIDVLIIARAGRIWTVRLLATLLLTVFGLRRHHQKITNRICLSFYLDDAALSLKQFSIGEDPLYAVWAGMIVPVYEATGSSMVRGFIGVNFWLSGNLPNHYFKVLSTERAVHDSRWSRAIRSSGELVLSGRVGDWCERVARQYQRKKIYAHTDSRVHRPGVDVVVNDHVLKFHESDARARARQLWQKRLVEYNLA